MTKEEILEELVEYVLHHHPLCFPDETLFSQFLKTEEELTELNPDPYNMEEAADVFIASVALAYRFKSLVGNIVVNYIIGQVYTLGLLCGFAQAVRDKMKVNLTRVWDKQEDGTTHHQPKLVLDKILKGE